MSLFEFALFLLPTNLWQPMHSQSALAELPSPNLAPFILLDPVVDKNTTATVYRDFESFRGSVV